MSDKKHIDRLFQEKFKDFEASPDPAVWKRINASLPQKKKKKRRVIIFWWEMAGIAAAVLLFIALGFSLFDEAPNDNTISPVVNTETTKKQTYPKSENTDAQLSKLNDFDTTITENNTANDTSNLASENTNLVNSDTYQNLNSSKTKNASSSLSSVTNSDTTNNLASKIAISHLKTTTIAQANNDSSKTSNNQTTIDEKTALDKLANTSDTVADVPNTTTDATPKNDLNTSETSNDKDILKSNLEDLTKPSIEDAIAQNDSINSDKAPEEKWSIKPNVAPIYFNSLDRGSSLDEQFAENSKSSTVSASYGIAGTYTIAKKLKLRAGINKLDLNQTTSNVLVFNALTSSSAETPNRQPNTINFNTNNDPISLISINALNRNSISELLKTEIGANQASLNQQLGFIEIPLELEYRVLDKKVGINLIGGFSTLFLSNNEIYIDVNDQSTLIGEANNINNASFTANLGLGFDYNIAKKWRINIEPTFKYQINTFNNTSGNFRPYFIGIYSGASFRF